MDHGSKFTLVAEAGRDAAADLPGLQRDLSLALNLSTPPSAESLLKGGAELIRVTSIQEAKGLIARLQNLDVALRVLDSQGNVVLESAHKAAAVDAPPAHKRTLIGGFQMAELQPPAGFQMAAIDEEHQGQGHPDEPTLEPPELAFLDQSSPSIPAPTLPSPVAPPTATAERSSPYLESLETGELMLLDGSEDQPDLSGEPLGLDDPIPQQFAPAVEDEELELADILPPVASATLAPPAAPPPDLGHQGDPLDFQQSPEQELPPPQMEDVREPRATRKRTIPAKRRVTGTSLRSQQRSTPMIFGGWLHEQQRLRMVIGFLLALGLGAIGPTCYSSSVIERRITPQLEDLSTVKAHGHILSHMPNYRSAEEIEETISSIKVRYGIFTILMWICISGIVGFAWFRLS